MNQKLRIFVSSVQKELENERLTVLALVTTDPFLLAHCDAVLYEHAPASPEVSSRECLALLDTCDVCLSIMGRSYGGQPDGHVSITHQEYRRAKEKNIPLLVYIKGDADQDRDDGTRQWLDEVRSDNLKYKRFGNILQLQKEVRASLVKVLNDRYGIGPTDSEETIAAQTIEAVSGFETQTMKRLKWQALDQAVARRLAARSVDRQETELTQEEILDNLIVRGLVWHDSETSDYYGTAAGIVLLAPDPSAVFPQARFLMDAYRGVEPDGDPMDHEDIRGPMPMAIERVLAFIDRNTRHPMKIVGLDRLRIDEYPPEALREALVNAVAHRNYEDAGRKIMVEVFPDRIVVSSPGMPPKPLTIKSLISGRYKPCSRNPIIAQSLSYFHRIEERGSGMKRMRAYMTEHGLEEPVFMEEMGYFEAVFRGPGKDIERLQSKPAVSRSRVPPFAEERLSPRQKEIFQRVLKTGSVTSGWCRRHFKVVYDTAQRDLAELVGLGILEQLGRGRTTKYIEKRNR